MNLLVPAAKVVSEELQNIGKLPTVIYPVTDKIVYDFLFDQYHAVCDKMKIMCYEEADKVHSKLKKYKKTKVIDIPRLDDLAHTVCYGLTDQAPVIINFGDTIVMDNIYNNEPDSFFYTEEYVSEKWTYFTLEDGKLTSIYDKKSEPNKLKKGNLFVGVFYLSSPFDFKSCIERCSFEVSDESVSVFYRALKLYSTIHPLKAIKTNNWFDIGHADKYFNSKLEVKAREFNHIKIDKNRGILTKTSDDKDKFIGEIKWYLKLPADVEYVRPRIFSYSTSYSTPYISMEYYAYHTVHELFLNGDLDIRQWETIFKRIKFIVDDFKRYKVSDEYIVQALEDMYLNKTLQRFEKLKEDVRFTGFFTDTIVVNGNAYKSLNDIIGVLKAIVPEMLYDVKEFNIIHGDLCFANMMVDNNLSFVKVIDPRGKFGKYDIYGDKRYELAKLLHSVDGRYDYIIKDLFEVSHSGNSINYTIMDKNRKFDLYSVFIEVFKEDLGDNLKKVELIEALLFLSMIPLHGESFDHQIVMLATGLDILNRVTNIKERS